MQNAVQAAHHLQAHYDRPASAKSGVDPGTSDIKVVGHQTDVGFGRVDFLWQLDNRTVGRLAIDPNTPVMVLERLAAHPIADVRAAVTDNENTPLCSIRALANDPDPDVRYQLAENHCLPLDLIRSLSNDENPYVACRAQQTYDRLQGY
jgi:hypothetical protein